MKKRMGIIMLVFLTALSLGTVTGVNEAAAVESISAYTNGPDTFTTPDFWGVAYFDGASFIQSVTFDLTDVAGAFFDFDGDASFSPTGLAPFATAPLIGTLTGLVPTDVASFVYANIVPGSGTGGGPDNPATLTINFVPNSFGPGDSFFFAADTDGVDGDSGGSFGQEGVIFSALLESGQSFSTEFVKLTNNFSVASITSCPCPIPVPPALYLFGSGLLGMWGLRRKQKNI
jgi:hypothetical protein